MPKRTITLKRFLKLDAELSALVQEGLPPETAEQIRGMYAVQYPDPSRRGKRIFFTFLVLAVLMLMMAVFLLVSFNWYRIPPQMKIISPIFFQLAAFALGVYFYRTKKIFSEIGLLAAGILYGVSIWQSAQVLQIPSDYTTGLWLWGIGVLLLAVWTRTPVLPIFSAVLFAVWGIMEISVSGGGSVLVRAFFPNYANGAYSLPMIAGIGWSIFSAREDRISAKFYYWLFLLWGLMLPIAWDWDEGVFWSWIVFAGTCWLVRVILRKKPPIMLEVIPMAVGLIAVSFYKVNKGLTHQNDAAGLLTLLANLLVIAWAVFLFTRRGKYAGRCFAAGVTLFLIWALCRYGDLCGFDGYLGAAGFFTVLAVLLVSAAFIWKKISKDRTAEIEETPEDEKIDSAGSLFFSRLKTSGTSRWASAGLLAALCFQAAVVGEMILSRTCGFENARLVSVETRPADPRSMFRGDYVTVNYAFSTPFDYQNNEIDRSELEPYHSRKMKGRTIYTVLEEKEGIARPVKITFDQPKEGLYLRGIVSGWRVKYGIESYFVQEGKGKEFEEVLRNQMRVHIKEPSAEEAEGESAEVQVQEAPLPAKKVIADILVKPNGEAKMVKLRIAESPIQ